MKMHYKKLVGIFLIVIGRLILLENASANGFRHLIPYQLMFHYIHCKPIPIS